MSKTYYTRADIVAMDEREWFPGVRFELVSGGGAVPMSTFDPEINNHPVPPAVEEDAVLCGVSQQARTCYVIYLTLDFATGEEPYDETEMAGIIAGLWDHEPGKGGRQDVTVFTCKNGEETVKDDDGEDDGERSSCNGCGESFNVNESGSETTCTRCLEESKR